LGGCDGGVTDLSAVSKARSQQIPWKAAGRVSEQLASGDDVVRSTGWVFHNRDDADLAAFVESGDHEVPAYLEVFGLRGEHNRRQTMIEIGSGIGRMTCAFTREFGSVIACDLDQGFLERCYETVAKFGKVQRLRTLEVADGHSLDIAPDSVDLAFSYITLQHCSTDDALDLAAEAVRVTVPGGKIALNFRGPRGSDAFLVPAGKLVRGLYRVPGIGRWASRRRTLTRLAWQVSRIHPDQVTGQIGRHLTDVQVWTNPGAKLSAFGAEHRTFEGINPAHWWIIATVTA